MTVESISEYQSSALRLGRKGFSEAHRGYFLVKRPVDEAGEPGESAESIEYRTIAVRTAGAAQAMLEGPESVPHANEWRVLPVAKREGNPFPERISVGRARNCDICVRVRFISKLHAHFLLGEDGALSLCDQRSVNGTFLNNEQLEPGQVVAIQPGDRVRFGALDVEIADAPRFYDILTTEARSR